MNKEEPLALVHLVLDGSSAATVVLLAVNTMGYHCTICIQPLVWFSILEPIALITCLQKPYQSNFRSMFGESPSLTIKRKAMRLTHHGSLADALVNLAWFYPLPPLFGTALAG